MSPEIPVVRNLMTANERVAAELKSRFDEAGILVLNLMSSPGAGKTTLLERTLSDLRDEFQMAVVEGDLQTDNDARRVAATGAQAVQVNTEGGCHLDATQVREAVTALDMSSVDILFIENVGNLVCPAEFALGEDANVTLLSVTEGDDKPEKYPTVFHNAQVAILTKTDLLPYVDFSLETATRHAMAVNAGLQVFPLSCKTAEGLDAWYGWLRTMRAGKKK